MTKQADADAAQERDRNTRRVLREPPRGKSHRAGAGRKRRDEAREREREEEPVDAEAAEG